LAVDPAKLQEREPMSNDTIISTIATFVATFLGAFFGLWLNYRYDRYKSKKSEDEDRQKMMTTLGHELVLVQKRIQDFVNLAGEYEALAAKINAANPNASSYVAAFPDIRLDRQAMDTSIHSGKLFLLDQSMFEALAEQYRRIDVVNRSSDDLRAIARAPVNRDYLPMIEALRGTVLGTSQNLLESIPSMAALLK
jgi:hypothetical protein